MKHKIETLVKRGWSVDIMSDPQRWYNVEFSHLSWGTVRKSNKSLHVAVVEAYKKAIEMEDL